VLADLPGYGFAKVSKEEKKKWGQLLETFLAKEKLSLVISLVDIRHKPTEDDVMMVNYLYHYALPFILVATKADKLAKTKVKPAAKDIANYLRVGAADIIPSSAETGLGKDLIFSAIEQAISVSNSAEELEEDTEE
jgi:GTP-binding protein